MKRSARIREMVEKMRDRNNASKAFTKMQQSNEKREDYYDEINKDNLSMQEDMLNPISFVASNNTYNLYYHQGMK